MQAAVHDGAGNTESRSDDISVWHGGKGVLRESLYELFKAGEVARGVTLFENLFENSAVINVGSEVAFRSADVARDDHGAARLSERLCQLFWSVLLCEFEHMAVVIALRESIGRAFINDERHIRMKLERGRANGRRDGAFDGFGDCGGFGLSGGENQNAAGVEDGADAHGNCAFWNFLALRKKAPVVFYGFPGELFQACARSEAGIGFVEADVAVAADSENLQIDAAGFFDFVFVAFAVFGIVGAEGAAGNMNSCRLRNSLGKRNSSA